MFLKSNIDYLLEKYKTNPNELSEKHGIPQSTIFRIQNGLTENPRQSTLKAISDWSGVDVGDLLTKDLRILDLIPNLTKVEDWDGNTPLDDDEVEIPFFKDFSFACGSGSISEAIANETRKLRMSKATLRNLSIAKENAIAAIAVGDSMNPTIKDGDTIHVDLGRKTIKDGKIFAICIGGLFYCKRLYNLPFGGARIVSDNSDEFPEIQLTADQINEQDFQIIGWVWQIATMERW
ncbi:S24 family peptidase [Acinetobacter gerneri]|uniref:S24 family peptidase n=1 Tax=Acinetobacter gerneri TaxID=202952 RepID=A0AAW8JF59_9GAMM|nr:S24 family peptidase [Acinetobacter gerneri]MDQ9009005.1 S24 family peptidase [Acinetobacter gerneri]MDQ9013109.1 S24 family peptidase [Acinetobacter gerneri]MDQ9024546.1 S24 family peptidase [Acinetobacter gerneri]MDQ9051781.1 S24 family peptidase [Acinetobacter gerneri]MDQ9059239.1 S24 family peptidase [Acinetobacter gerneri]